MKTRWVILALVAVMVLACAKPPPQEAVYRDPIAELTEYVRLHKSPGPEYSKYVLDVYSEFLQETSWEPRLDWLDWEDEAVLPDKEYRKNGIAREIEDFKDYKKLVRHLGISDVPYEPGVVYAGVRLEGKTKPLDDLSVDEQETLLAWYRAKVPKVNKSCIPYTPLMLIPAMAASGESKFTSTRDIVGARYKGQPPAEVISLLEGISGALKERDQKLVELDDAIEEYERRREDYEEAETRANWLHLAEQVEVVKSVEIPDYGKWLRENILPEYRNRVVGGLFEPWHVELSPGNGVIRRVTDESEVARLRTILAEQAKREADNYVLIYLKDAPEKIFFFVYRLYGCDEVIAEGVVWYMPDLVGWKGVMKRAEDYTMPRIIQALKANKVDSHVLGVIELFNLERGEPIDKISQEWLDTMGETKVSLERKRQSSVLHAQEGSVLGARDICARLGLSSGHWLKRWSVLTQNEKRSLYSNALVSAEYRIEMMAENRVQSIGSLEDLADLLRKELGKDYWELASDARFQGCHSDMFDTWLSPITGITFEPWHRAWSKGNGYIVEITDEMAIVQLKALYEKELDTDEPPYRYEREKYETDSSGLRFYYVRLYGEAEGSIISEGIWHAWPPNPMRD